jgi:hypothetical protein
MRLLDSILSYVLAGNDVEVSTSTQSPTAVQWLLSDEKKQSVQSSECSTIRLENAYALVVLRTISQQKDIGRCFPIHVWTEYTRIFSW